MEPARQYTKGLESSAARSILLTSTIRLGPLEGIGVFRELAPDSPWRHLDSRLFSRQLTVHSEAADSIWGGPKMVADQPWMHIHIEKFDEVSRICRNNCKIVIKRILPYLMIRPTG